MAAKKNKYEFFLNGVGRFVSGSLTQKRDKDIDGRPIAEDDRFYDYGVAVRKDDPWIGTFFAGLSNFLGTEWASHPAKLQAYNNWFNTMSGLSMKISDGDKPNKKGQVNENTIGHFVFWFTSKYEVKTVDPHNQDIPPEVIKRGHYVQFAANIQDNDQPYDPGPRNRAGVYLNPEVIRLVAEGDEIKGGVNAEEKMGGTTAANIQLPPGARAIGSSAGMPGMASSPGATMPGTQPAGNVAMPGAGQPMTQQQHMQPVQGQPQMGAATMPVAGGITQNAQPPTASPGNIQPHPGILQGPNGTQQPPAGNVAMPGAGQQPQMPGGVPGQ